MSAIGRRALSRPRGTARRSAPSRRRRRRPPIRIVVPYAPGGITDVIARALGTRLSEAWKQQVVIENKPGGNSQVGAELVAKSAPDGTTLMVTSDATFVMNPHLYSKLSYDAVNDFVQITGLGISPQALILHPSVPARTVGELVALAKQKPGAINYGTFGPGSSGHLNIELLQSMTGTKFTPVHYRGAAPALTDTIAGHIQMMIVSIGLVAQPWQAGQLKVLGLRQHGADRKIPRGADDRREWAARASRPARGTASRRPRARRAPIVDRINAETQRIFNDPAFRERVLAPSFIYSIASSPEAFVERIRRDTEKWGKVIREANIKGGVGRPEGS